MSSSKSVSRLAFNSIAPVVLSLSICSVMTSGTASAQDVNEEIRKATELAISNSIGEALSESLDRSVAIRDATSENRDTFYSQGAYGWFAEGSDAVSGAGNLDVDVFRALGGTTAKVNDQLFAGFALSATNVTFEVDGFADDFSLNFYTLAGNGSYFLYKDKGSRAWASGLYQFTYIDLDFQGAEDNYSNSISPSLNYAMDFQPMSVELTGGLSYSTNSESSDDFTSALGAVKFKTDVGDFVPQLVVSYATALNSEVDSSSVSIRPEVNYRREDMVFGIGYSNTRQLEQDFIRQNEAFVNFRWRF